MKENREEAEDRAERQRPPGQPRSWEQREDPGLSSEKRWARLAKALVYSVWITLLVIAIVATLIYVRSQR